MRLDALRAAVRVALASLLVLVAGGVRAADDADPLECRPDGNQQQMNACAVRDFRRADATLNIRYGEAMEALSPTMRGSLRTEQRAWLRARDPDCKRAAKASEGGSIWALVFYTCLERSTRERTVQIDRWKDRNP